ncbi:hypothetical protein HHI36_020130 [Cryptolaemus montrouzieri]|uniref:Uncharacterized protein n=1 Tax=Cryptolaemus montrouzieri TaxID=559131 RepID=A0ABD2N9R5_9CUCU
MEFASILIAICSATSSASVPISINVTDEEANQQAEKELIITSTSDETSDSFETIAARKDSDAYVEVIIGVLTAIMLLLLVVFMIILILNKRSKLQGSPTLFRNPFAMKINMKIRSYQCLVYIVGIKQVRMQNDRQKLTNYPEDFQTEVNEQLDTKQPQQKTIDGMNMTIVKTLNDAVKSHPSKSKKLDKFSEKPKISSKEKKTCSLKTKETLKDTKKK